MWHNITLNSYLLGNKYIHIYIYIYCYGCFLKTLFLLYFPFSISAFKLVTFFKKKCYVNVKTKIICIYQWRSMRSMWHKINFLSSFSGLNSEFSFSKTGCHIKVKEPSQPYYLPIPGRKLLNAYLSHRYSGYVKCKLSHPRFEPG